MGKVTGFLEIQRKKWPTRPVAERIHDWREVYLPYPDADLKKQAARCMDCGVPFCHQETEGGIAPWLRRCHVQDHRRRSDDSAAE